MQPVEITLDFTPRSRFDIIDVSALLTAEHRGLFERYPKIACCSFHTTAGYLEQEICAKLCYSETRLTRFIGRHHSLFPPNSGFLHDIIEMRDELTEAEKEQEPLNADSHLTFISAGLKNCVTYLNQPKLPIYFIDLDGVSQHHTRTRRTTVVAYNNEEIVYHGRFVIPVTGAHPIDTFNLRDPRYGLFSHLTDLIKSCGIEKGLIEIRLAREERHAALTVNEYETLLMRNDLCTAMSNPFEYMLRRGKRLLQHPAAIPAKTKGYLAYDLIRLYNELMKDVRIGHSLVNKVLSSLSTPVRWMFRLKRNITLLVSSSVETGAGCIVQGTYQSPILIQRQKAERGVRWLEITLRKF